jgi:small subunit ribosomal protein S16
MGCNNKPFYRVVVADARNPVKGRFIETVGWYDPKMKTENFKIDLDRVEYWKGNGAILSDTVKNIVKRARIAAEQAAMNPPPTPEPEEAPAAEAAPAEAPVEETEKAEAPAEEEKTEAPAES